MRLQFAHTRLTPGMIVLLVIGILLFAVILIPIMIAYGIYCLLFGRPIAPAFFRGGNTRRRSDDAYEDPFRRSTARDAASETDDAIECEVISARTIDEDGREIR